MTSKPTWPNGPRIRPGTVVRRRWACPDPDCTQDRLTAPDAIIAPICPAHARPMTRRRKVTRRRGA